MDNCPRCGHPMIQAASHPVPWCSVYGTHATPMPRIRIDHSEPRMAFDRGRFRLQ